MKKIIFYKWYGLFLAIIIQSLFFFVYDKLGIKNYEPWIIYTFIIIYQGIFIIAAINYFLLYKAYKDFQEMKAKQKEENDKIDQAP